MNTYTFLTSFLTFYLKGQITVSNTMVGLKIPNTILKFIPLGSASKNIPITQVASVDTSFHLDLQAALAGLVITIIGFCMFESSWFFALILVIWGLVAIASSLNTLLRINETSGNSITINAVFIDKNAMMTAADNINFMLANRVNDTNTRAVVQDSTDRIVNAFSQNQNNK